MPRLALIVLDGLGVGAAADAESYGDCGSDTLGNVARAVGGLDLPYLESLGLGCCGEIAGVGCSDPVAAHGIAEPASPGKDSTTGHWEICGVVLDHPFPVYPDGFPDYIVEEFSRRTGRGVLGNRAASGTAIIDELGDVHRRTGDWIVYTSADSVFQIAAHEAVVPLEQLYRAGECAREILRGEHAVSRVIARPFEGEPGAYRRTAGRRDFSVEPPRQTLLDRLARSNVPRVGVGKVDDLFAGRSISSEHTPTNPDAYRLIASVLDSLDHGLLFANVIEFDQSWGHRNDVDGFHRGLVELDRHLPRIVDRLSERDMIILTADHGNDPTTRSTDHSRERVPILVIGDGVRPADLGVRRTFADIGATVADFFGVELDTGVSFLNEVRDG